MWLRTYYSENAPQTNELVQLTLGEWVENGGGGRVQAVGRQVFRVLVLFLDEKWQVYALWC